MTVLLLIFFTFFIAIVCGAVLLIQLGGWLAILAAILSVCYFFLSVSMILILGAGSVANKRQQKGENEP